MNIVAVYISYPLILPTAAGVASSGLLQYMKVCVRACECARACVCACACACVCVCVFGVARDSDIITWQPIAACLELPLLCIESILLPGSRPLLFVST